MSGAFLQPPTRPDADWGVLFVEVSGLLPMCGHGTIGVATVLVETGMVEVTEPETRIRLDTPAGLVEATVAVSGGRAERVTLRNVPAFVAALDAPVEVERSARRDYDMAYGGNFYALVPAASIGLDPVPAELGELIARGLAIADAINASAPPVHPLDAAIRGCKHVVFHAPGEDGANARNATAIHPGWLDRSPCGTGTSARMAALHARGELAHRSGVRQRVDHRQPVHRPAGRRGCAGRDAGCRARGHRPGLDHRDGPVPARPDRPVPGRLRSVAPGRCG